MNQEESEQNEVELDRMKKGADSTGKVIVYVQRPHEFSRYDGTTERRRKLISADVALRSHSIACNAH